MGQVALARAIATGAHAGQVDKAGEPYIGHPARVAARVVADDWGPNVVAAAWLHDVIEDTGVSAEDLADLGVNAAVIDMVVALTHQPGEARADYLARVKGLVGAVAVKAADVADNTDPARLAKLPPEVQARLVAKYAETKQVLGIE